MTSNSTQCLSEHHHSEHPEVFHVLVHLVALAGKWITFFGSFVLIAGVSISVLNIILSVVNSIFSLEIPMLLDFTASKKAGHNKASFSRVRLQLGEITALGLEILVVADVMETLNELETKNFSLETLAKIGAVALLRTLLAYALGSEVKEIQKEISREERANENKKEEKPAVSNED